VIDEPFDHGCLDSALQIYRQGRPLLLERLRLDQQLGLTNRANLRGYPVTATLVATPVAGTLLNEIREAFEYPVDAHLGFTLLENLLVVRYLGASTEQARELFIRIWSQLRPQVIGRAPCAPRIWAT
jgi:urease accessory protein